MILQLLIIYLKSAVAAVLRGPPYTLRSTPSHPSSSFIKVDEG